MKLFKNQIFLFSLFFGLFFISGCKKTLIEDYSVFYDLGEEGMKPKMEYLFYPFKNIINDSIPKNLKVYLVTRYHENTPINYLPLELEYYDSNLDTIKNYEIKLNLFDDSGLTEGKGSYGIYESKYELMSLDHLYKDFFLSISTIEEKTQGLISLGVVCENYR